MRHGYIQQRTYKCTHTLGRNGPHTPIHTHTYRLAARPSTSNATTPSDPLPARLSTPTLFPLPSPPIIPLNAAAAAATDAFVVVFAFPAVWGLAVGDDDGDVDDDGGDDDVWNWQTGSCGCQREGVAMVEERGEVGGGGR